MSGVEFAHVARGGQAVNTGKGVYHVVRRDGAPGLLSLIVVSEIVAPAFDEPELRGAATNLNRAANAIANDLENLNAITCDRGLWDDVYNDDLGDYPEFEHSNLARLTLKTDQSFVRRLTDSVTNARVVQAIVALGKAMGLQVIAEGIETGQQLRLVQTCGCDLAQGLFIARPMPEIEFLNWSRSLDQTANGLHMLPGPATRKGGDLRQGRNADCTQ